MKSALKVLGYVSMILVLSGIAQAKEWRGIVPLHSTKDDVEKLLGPPPPPSDGTRIYSLDNTRSIYFLDEGEVYIVFADKAVPAAAGCLGKISPGTIMLIQVTPKKALQLPDLNLDEQRLKKFDPSDPPNIGFAAYVDEEEGISVRTCNEKIHQINYFAAAKDRHLCPSYYEGPKWFCAILVDFLKPPVSRKIGEYDSLSLNVERPYLNELATQLEADSLSSGYIIAYAGRRARINEAKALADRAKDYLGRERKINPDRLVTIDGGYREEWSVELYLVPAGAPVPTAKPTVKLSEVRRSGKALSLEPSASRF